MNLFPAYMLLVSEQTNSLYTIFKWAGQDTYTSEYLVVKFIFPHLQRYYAGMKISIRTEGNKI